MPPAEFLCLFSVESTYCGYDVLLRYCLYISKDQLSGDTAYMLNV